MAPLSKAASLLVAAASDLASAEQTLRVAFEQASGSQIRFVFHSSGMLARQIENGAPYDVYLSANEQYVSELVRSGDMVADTVVVYAQGRLGLWSLDGSVTELKSLLRDEVRHVAIANPVHAPYGLAARQALMHEKLWEPLRSKIVFAENVRQTFQYGSSGNADAIITSWTLVFDKGGKQIPSELHAPIRQAGGVLRQSSQQETARRFLRFLTSPQGRKALATHGLFPPPPSQ
jgi:molybdate transport system substrate-binding protein